MGRGLCRVQSRGEIGEADGGFVGGYPARMMRLSLLGGTELLDRLAADRRDGFGDGLETGVETPERGRDGGRQIALGAGGAQCVCGGGELAGMVVELMRRIAACRRRWMLGRFETMGVPGPGR